MISHSGIADIKKYIGTAKHKLRANDESQSRKLQNFRTDCVPFLENAPILVLTLDRDRSE